MLQESNIVDEADTLINTTQEHDDELCTEVFTTQCLGLSGMIEEGDFKFAPITRLNWTAMRRDP